MNDDELKAGVLELQRLQAQAGGTLNPLLKAKIAERAVSVAVDVVAELVGRELERAGE